MGNDRTVVEELVVLVKYTQIFSAKKLNKSKIRIRNIKLL